MRPTGSGFTAAVTRIRVGEGIESQEAVDRSAACGCPQPPPAVLGWPPSRRARRHAPRRLRPSARPLRLLAAAEHGPGRGAGQGLPGRRHAGRGGHRRRQPVRRRCSSAPPPRRPACSRSSARWWPLAPLEALPRTPGPAAAGRARWCCWSRTPTGYGNLLRLLSRAYVGAEPGGGDPGRAATISRPPRRA